MSLCSRSRIRARGRAFTLIELIVTIAVLLILMGIAVAMFNGTRGGAQDTQAKSALLVSFRDSAGFSATNGSFTDDDTAMAALVASEPQYTYSKSSVQASTGPNHVDLEVTAGGDIITLCAKSHSGKVFCIRDDEAGQLVLAAHTTPAAELAGQWFGANGTSIANDKRLAKSWGYSRTSAVCQLPTRLDPPGTNCTDGAPTWDGSGASSGGGGPVPTSFSYASGNFPLGQNSATLTPTVTNAPSGHQFVVTAGSLPANVTLNPTTGVLTGPASGQQGNPGLSISSGGTNSCAVDADNNLSCWGQNLSNAGDNPTTTATNVLSPTLTTSGAGGDIVKSKVTTYNGCAQTDQDALICWGRQSNGMVGNGVNSGSSVGAYTVFPNDSVIDFDMSDTHVCAVMFSGDVKCWGSNSAGQIYWTLSGTVTTPTSVPGVQSGSMNFDSVVTGTSHTCALDDGHDVVRCWGSNDDNVVHPSSDSVAAPQAHQWDFTVTGAELQEITAGAQFTCVRAYITSSGQSKLRCWGKNASGQLGNGTTSASPDVSWVKIDASTDATNVSSIDADANTACLVTSTNEARCWGASTFGILGHAGGNSTYAEVAVAAGTVHATPAIGKAIAVGSRHACAVTQDSHVRCWGDNTYGQRGQGNTNSLAVGSGINAVGYGPTPGFPTSVTIELQDSGGAPLASQTLALSNN